MPAKTTRKIAVTFTDGLPGGVEARFTAGKVVWVAYPEVKATALRVVTDQLIAVVDGCTRDLTRWLNAHPTDAQAVVRVAKRVAVGQRIVKDFINDKTAARIIHFSDVDGADVAELFTGEDCRIKPGRVDPEDGNAELI